MDIRILLTLRFRDIGIWTASMIQRASASQKRLNEFLETRPVVANSEAIRRIELKGKIEFRNVNFTYPHTNIHALKNFNLIINPGEQIALIGRTGSGKSTVAQLLLRMYDVDSGEILLDGINIKNIELSNLRRQISYVPQDGFLFSDTVENNIAFGALQADIKKVEQAASMAVVDKEIEGFPDKYKTIVGERGVTLSGGQKQRVSIARALMKEAPVLILDDALSAVDARTEKAILFQLDHYLHTKTSLFITHRIFNLLNFHKIIVLENGCIAEQGKHAELIALDGIYAEMYAHQTQENNDE